MENWDDYRFILALSRYGTVRGAAHQLRVTHSTVSRRLAVINDRYGAPVFERIAGGYRPTELGDQLLAAARRMEQINYAANRKQRAQGVGEAGPITISIPGVMGQFFLLDALDEFSRMYPEIELTINSGYHFADLDKSEADVVVRATSKPPEHLVGRKLFSFYLNYYCRVDYLEKTPTSDVRWIVNSRDPAPEEWIVKTPFPEAPIGWRLDDFLLRHLAALQGRGIYRGTCYMADPDPNLMALEGSEPFPWQDIWVLTHPDLKNTPRVKLLMRFISKVLTEKQDLLQGRYKVSQ